jgi:glycosyltransferase involved in cell wall biosynthesis
LKKIVFTVTNDLTYDQRMIRICTTLATEGYDVTLVGRKMKTSQSFDYQQIKHKRFSLLFNKGKFFYVEYNFRLFFWLLFQRFDIVCGIDLDTILPCYFAAILRGGKPCVYDAHELFTDTPEVERRPTIQKIWLAVERFIVPRVKHCYTVGQSVADEFEKRYSKKFEVIRNLPIKNHEISKSQNYKITKLPNYAITQSPNYPITKLPNYPITQLPNILIYQGALNEGRGLEQAIEAMQDVENCEFWLVGEGDLSEILRGRVVAMKMENKVKFLGFIKPKDLPNITRHATIGLNIAEDKSLSYRLSLPNKIFDYIQAGVPQICIQFIEFQRLNDAFNIAYMIPKAEKRLIAEAINRLLSDKDLYQNLKENCAKAADVLTWENEQKKLLAFYSKI